MTLVNLGCGHVKDVPAEPLPNSVAFCGECSKIQPILSVAEPTAAAGNTNGSRPQRSYGCSWGCGNPYDYVFVSVADGTTEFLCLPCMVKLAKEMVEAVLSPEGEAVMAALADMSTVEQAPMRSGKTRRRGHEAPANADDPDLIEAFDSRITEDELPDDFK